MYTNNVAPGPNTESPVVTRARKVNLASLNQRRYSNDAAANEAKVARANEQVETLNSRIVPVLEGTTGKALGDNPKAWWDWWRDQNEYYAESSHDVDRYYYSDTSDYYYPLPGTYLINTEPSKPIPTVERPRYPRKRSCFAKGTLVWTKTGTRPIETIENGDLVLAQDVDTGELKYRPVIGLSVRPPSPIVNVSLGNESILATKGHPFWVAGAGWRMAKEMADGDVLHSVSGSTTIKKVEPSGEAEAYNLIVADFNTYFVGQHGFLVHDNTPRRPTQALLPGILKK
jgi:hypothetical protein